MDVPTAPTGPTRRTVLSGAALAVPAIALTASSPAFAASGAHSVTVSTPNMQATAAGDTPVTVTVTDIDGQPVTSGSVSLTGPSGVGFSPASPTISNGTATTTMTTTDPWAVPGSSLTITAVGDGASGSAGLTVLGANALANGLNVAFHGVTTGASGTGSPTNPLSPPTQLLRVFPSPIVSLVQGDGNSSAAHALALLQDGTVWGVGKNTRGQLGDGTTTSRTTWAMVPGLTGVVEIRAGGNFSLARLNTGELRAWGANNVGQLGDGTTTDSSTPVAVQNITDATQIAAGSANGWALLSTGDVCSWGFGPYGGIGNGSTDHQTVPVTVPGITTAVQISSADFTPYVLLQDGQIMTWGYGYSGERGDGESGSTAGPAAPVSVLGINTAIQVSAFSGGAVALLDGGEVRAWGVGRAGTLGNGSTSDSSTPVAVTGITDATRVVTTWYSAFAQLASGGYVAWGRNAHEELNDGTTTNRTTAATWNPPSPASGLPCAGRGSAIIFTLA